MDANFLNLLKELDQAAGEMQAAYDKVLSVCERIVASNKTGETLVPALGVAGRNQPSNTNHRTSRAKGPGKGIPAWRNEVKEDPAAAATARPWKKVKCQACAQAMGSRRFKDVDYPILHKDASTGKACKGSFQAGLPTEA